MHFVGRTMPNHHEYLWDFVTQWQFENLPSCISIAEFVANTGAQKMISINLFMASDILQHCNWQRGNVWMVVQLLQTIQKWLATA
jgi:hypothetical protein